MLLYNCTGTLSARFLVMQFAGMIALCVYDSTPRTVQVLYYYQVLVPKYDMCPCTCRLYLYILYRSPVKPELVSCSLHMHMSNFCMSIHLLVMTPFEILDARSHDASTVYSTRYCTMQNEGNSTDYWRLLYSIVYSHSSWYKYSTSIPNSTKQMQQF